MNAIKKLFEPRSVAIIGASSDATKTSGRPLAFLLKHGFTGDLYPVNPKLSDINGVRCYPSVLDLPSAPDVALVLLGSERATQAVKELAQIGTGCAIILASGYTETGEQGALRQQQLLDAAGTMRILGPNTIGLVNLSNKTILSASGALVMDHLPSGNIAIVSQSGGILGAFLSRAAARGIGLSKLISTSNEADLELADFIDALVDDANTQVIALYIETIREPHKFRAAALRSSQAGKPIVAFKIGRSEAGARAAVSHTGALAGSDKMYDALFKLTNVIRAESFGELLDISSALSNQRVLLGRRVAILTSTGGAGTLVSDCLGVAGFETPPPDSHAANALRDLQTGDHAVLDRNPIDVTLAGLQPDLLRQAIQILLASPTYDALVVIVGASGLSSPNLMADAIKACLQQSDKPVIAYISPHAPQVEEILNNIGVPAFTSAESCTAALKSMLRINITGVDLARPNANPLEASHVLDNFPRGTLNEVQAKALFKQFGITCTTEVVVHTPEQAQVAAVKLGGKVALKLLSNHILHKSDVGGVALNLHADNIQHEFSVMTATLHANTQEKPTDFIVQSMISGGVELILGMYRDNLGTAILLGAGGVTAELFKDTTMCMLPSNGQGLDQIQALSMLKSLISWPLLDGFRGREKVDIQALTLGIVAFSTMVAQLGEELLEAEINPLFVMSKGNGIYAADGLVVLKK